MPTTKQMLSDIFNGFLYPGGGGPRRSSNQSSKIRYTDYGGYSRDRDRYRDERREPRRTYDYDTLEFDFREDAEAVLDEMRDILRDYPFVTVADMFEAARESCDYTAKNYGWTDIGSAHTERTRYGKYIIRLPRPMPIER